MQIVPNDVDVRGRKEDYVVGDVERRVVGMQKQCETRGLSRHDARKHKCTRNNVVINAGRLLRLLIKQKFYSYQYKLKLLIDIRG